MRFIVNGRLLALALGAVLLATAPAAAESAPKGGKKDEKHEKPTLYVKHGDHYDPASDADLKAAGAGDHGHESHGILDKLDFTGIKRYDLGIYTLIVFALLMFVLTKFAWPHIKEGLEKREQNIRGALDEAKKDREDARVAMEAAKKQLDTAAAQVKAMLDEARRDADALKTAKQDEGVKEAVAIVERARREIAADKDSALKDLNEHVVKLAAMMSEKALRRSVSTEDHRRLLDESIAELKTAANKA